jgi:phage terminase large subunit GpA-like protein
VTGRSRVERFYEESDKRQFWIPCPHCSEMMVLKVAQLRWRPGEPETARYYCEACARPIENHQKEWMLPLGEWRPRTKSRIHGYHLSSMYSPVGWLSWAQVAEKREKAGQDPEKLQIFYNTILGEAWADAAEVPDTERLFERREGYEIGVVPRGGLLLTCGVDVQVRRLECEIVAWGRNKESWSIDYRVFEGEATQPYVWRQLAELLNEEFETEYGRPTRIKSMAVDSGYATMAVYDFVRKMAPGTAMAVKGQTHVPTVVGVPKTLEAGASACGR